jgi:hypothetical protein
MESLVADTTFAEQMVAKYQAILLESAGLKSVTVVPTKRMTATDIRRP